MRWLIALVLLCGCSSKLDTSESVVPPSDCDHDGDGWQGPQCGGKDCCDEDSRTRPGAFGTYSEPDACGSFDRNCDGAETPQHGAGACTPISSTNCGVVLGFREATACGDTGALITSCGADCYPITTDTVQECR